MDKKEINILLVDDEPDFVEPVALWLNSKGYNVQTAGNGKEAVLKVRQDPPHIIFMDINMPEMDGLEALKEIRTFNRDVPVILITAAYKDEEKINKAKECGISGIFAKNYTFDQLANMIHVALKTHKQLQGQPGEDTSGVHG